jgi:hypothetical protein
VSILASENSRRRIGARNCAAAALDGAIALDAGWRVPVEVELGKDGDWGVKKGDDGFDLDGAEMEQARQLGLASLVVEGAAARGDARWLDA